MKIVILCLLLSGCSAIPMPTLDLCEQVSYQRVGKDITVGAVCRVP